MRGEGVKDFSQYLGSREGREEDLMPDFFLDDFLEMEQKNLGIKSIHKGRYGGGGGVVVQALNVKGTNTPPPSPTHTQVVLTNVARPVGSSMSVVAVGGGKVNR